MGRFSILQSIPRITSAPEERTLTWVNDPGRQGCERMSLRWVAQYTGPVWQPRPSKLVFDGVAWIPVPGTCTRGLAIFGPESSKHAFGNDLTLLPSHGSRCLLIHKWEHVWGLFVWRDGFSYTSGSPKWCAVFWVFCLGAEDPRDTLMCPSSPNRS